MIVYLSEILPDIPVSGVLTFSECCGSYISKVEGTTGLGKLNNFKFPVPVTVISKSNDSPNFRPVLEGVTLKLNFPTAPEKSSGFPANGNGFTEITLLPAETRLLSSTNCTCPKKLGLPLGTWQSISNESGSISKLPDFCGYNTVLRKTT